jgi:hypothetical protein
MVTASAEQSAEQSLSPEKALCYVVTAHRPSAVLASVTCALTGPDDINLVISKCTRLEIHKVVEGGLVGLADAPIYGRIVALEVCSQVAAAHQSLERACASAAGVQVLHPEGRSTAALLLFTATQQYFILEWDATHGRLVTVASGDTRERIARPCERGTYTAVDPTGTVAVVHQYDGILRVLRLDPATAEVKLSFMERVEELAILEMRFLHSTDDSKHILAVLHDDFRNNSRRCELRPCSHKRPQWRAVADRPACSHAAICTAEAPSRCPQAERRFVAPGRPVARSACVTLVANRACAPAPTSHTVCTVLT